MDHPADADDLDRRFAFLNEADRLKGVLRASLLHDGSRRENSAEHSWHTALHALILAPEAGAEVDIGRVLKMLLIHDLVEIDTGDVPIHAAGGTAHHSAETMAAEDRAARRIFGLLPGAEGAVLLALWQEFEANETPDARFAKSVDRLPPVLANMANGGGSWRDYEVTLAQLDSRVGNKIAVALPRVWAWLRPRLLRFF